MTAVSSAESQLVYITLRRVGLQSANVSPKINPAIHTGQFAERTQEPQDCLLEFLAQISFLLVTVRIDFLFGVIYVGVQAATDGVTANV